MYDCPWKVRYQYDGNFLFCEFTLASQVTVFSEMGVAEPRWAIQYLSRAFIGYVSFHAQISRFTSLPNSSIMPRKYTETHKEDPVCHPLASQFPACNSLGAILTSLYWPFGSTSRSS
jgi:hypothetical protein